MKFQIRKMHYSHAPWRLQFDNGEDVYAPKQLDHAFSGKITYPAPICANTKQGLVDEVLRLLAIAYERLNAQEQKP